MTKRLLILFCAVVLLFAVTSLADRESVDESKLKTHSYGTAGTGEWKGVTESRAVVWDNGSTFEGIAASQVDITLDPILDPLVADDFLFDADQLVNDIHWIGGYWNGPPDDGDFDWEIIFYDDFGDGTKPGTVIASYYYTNAEVNETFLEGTPGGINYYNYSVDLPATLNFIAGTKYWVSMQGIGAYPPQSGIAYHQSPIALHEAVFRSNYFGYPDWTNGLEVFGYSMDLCFQLTYTEECNWIPGDDHKMHWPQLPDETGWAVNATQPLVLADDFLCMQTGWIKDVHWWGAWMNGIEGEVLTFVLSLHTDIPAAQSPTGYSMPGITLWEVEIPGMPGTPFDPPTMEGWYDPSQGLVVYDDHQPYYQYDVCLDEQYWVWQDSNTVYWLNISAIVAEPAVTQWGWKSTQDHWNDDAVYAFWGNLDWQELYEPSQSSQCDTVANGFYITVDPFGTFLDGFGENAFGEGWYFYPMEDWWNIWFYDHPFTYDNYKTGLIDFDVFPMDPGQPSYFEIAVNWSTDLWALDFPGIDRPPLPGEPEELYIGRQTLFAGELFEGHYTLDYMLPDYNPEWVSVDVRGYNYIIPGGVILHACCPKEPVQQSLDLAFVITGEAPSETGACCYDPTGGIIEAACVVMTQAECESLGGVYQGDDVPCSAPEACCLPDGSCIDADPLCCVNELGGVPQGVGTSCSPLEACCMPGVTCQMLDPLCCVDMGGVPQGVGSQCTQLEACCMNDGTCQMLDPVCCDDEGGVPQGAGTVCTAPRACCMQDGSCAMLDPLCCNDQGGVPSPIGSPTCLGDGDLNGTDDACEGGWQEGDDHKMHWPQLPDEDGWDVKSCFDVVLADDWRCSQTGPIKDFHFWGSWQHGLTGQITAFDIKIYSDLPAHQNPDGYSKPLELLWQGRFEDFGIVQFDPATMEGWYDPATGESLYNDHQQYFQYNIYIEDEQEWFPQFEDSIYWVSIYADVVDPATEWGWKSSEDHFNDDAVWRIPGGPDWEELYEPGGGGDMIVNAFFVEFDEQGNFMTGGGENAFDEGWYYYPWYDWWNVWFYDHPFAYDRYKTVHIEFDIFPHAPGPTWIELAVNWSTDIWSLEQPPGDSAPPLPGVDEDLYIGREILFASDYPEGHYFFDFVIPDYNPEWVSIDVRGFNFIIPEGFIAHTCAGAQSLDLAFVVTGEAPCDCLPGDANNSGNYNILDITHLINYLYKSGPPPTPYTLCSGDANCECAVNILDVTYLINFLYKFGPPPCDCPTWLSICGPPLRK